jgi:chlorobactene glucosyltransferase
MSIAFTFQPFLQTSNIALFAVLYSAVSLWVYLITVGLRSHFCTPLIKKSDKITLDNCSSLQLPFLSIIVPARNEEENIEKCLLSLISQDYPSFEIIAVDDNSTDTTLAIMKKIKSSLDDEKRLKVISLRTKPEGWTGKTWASQQGYMQSRGDILLFTDADSYYKSKDAVMLTVMQMWQEKLDVLTGVPYFPLQDFWSKVVMPVWNLYSEIFGSGIADVNKPKSKVAFVMGSFFMIRRQVFEAIGTYQHVRHEIQEDKAIGAILKRNHYNIRMFKVDHIVSALLSRDRITLWHVIRRTIVPMAIGSRWRVVQHMFIFFFMIVMPFALLPYTIILSHSTLNYYSLQSVLPLQYFYKLEHYPGLISSVVQGAVSTASLIFINVFLCLLIITAPAVKGFSKYRLPPYYAIASIAGAVFLIAVYAYSIIPFLIGHNIQPISWRGRMHDLSLLPYSKRKLQQEK